MANKHTKRCSMSCESESRSVVSDSLWTPMDCRVHGILQARILESVPFSRGSSQPWDRTQVSCIAGGFFTSWATREWAVRGDLEEPGGLQSMGSQLKWLSSSSKEISRKCQPNTPAPCFLCYPSQITQGLLFLFTSSPFWNLPLYPHNVQKTERWSI